jgi:NAD(P) transhydrogenase subunit beta
MDNIIDNIIEISYFVAAILFIMGLKKMSSPVTARSGIIWAGVGMLVATLITYLHPGMHNYMLMTVAIFVGGVAAWWSGKKVAITDMPQMIALYNGMGGGAAGAIAAVELLKGRAEFDSQTFLVLAILGALIGSVSFSGSLVAFAKLQGWLRRPMRFPGQQIFNIAVFLVAVGFGAMLLTQNEFSGTVILIFFVAALAYGLLMTLPIGGADMPVVISLFNALTGLAVAFEGFVLNNAAMIIAGTVVGSAGTLLTQLMARAMNRSIGNVLFSSFGASGGDEGDSVEGSHRCGRRRHHDGLCGTRRHNTGLWHGRGAGTAQGVGTGNTADQARCRCEVCHPPGGRPHARPHERTACRGQRAL